MVAKRKMDVYESDTVTYLRRGTLDILDAVAVQLPDVFYGEILPKLDMTGMLNLAQVNKAYNDAVWSAEGVRSMRAKIKAHLVEIGKKKRIVEPYYWAAKHGNVPAVRALLESGVDVNKGLTQDKRTALYVAAQLGHAAVVKALIEAGADVNKLASPHYFLNDASGKRRKRSDVLRDVTPVFDAADKGHTHVVMELIKAGADVNLARHDGASPLHTAALFGHEGCAAVLIHAGADVHRRTNTGTTPIKLAIDNEHEKIAKLLRQLGARDD